MLPPNGSARQGNTSFDLAGYRLSKSRHSCHDQAALWIQAEEQRGARGSGARVIDWGAQEIQSFEETEPGQLGLSDESGRPDKRHEFKLKRIAFHAKLNCGQCVSKHGNKCSDGPFCSNFFLHKFRHTFATRNLQDHVCDIKTLQNWLGHSDLASTMVYLKSVRNKDVMARVNSSELAALVVV